MGSTGWIAVLVGVILALVAVFAEQIGIGGASFGLKHLAVLGLGIVLVVGGLGVSLLPSRASR
jgi:hypothetical protein